MTLALLFCQDLITVTDRVESFADLIQNSSCKYVAVWLLVICEESIAHSALGTLFFRTGQFDLNN
jgi:hypothetical protein